MKLTYLEKMIVGLRKDLSITKTAKVLKVTVGRVVWIEKKAKAKLANVTPGERDETYRVPHSKP